MTEDYSYSNAVPPAEWPCSHHSFRVLCWMSDAERAGDDRTVAMQWGPTLVRALVLDQVVDDAQQARELLVELGRAGFINATVEGTHQ